MLARYMRRMRNNNLEIRIAGSSCCPQYSSLLVIITKFKSRKKKVNKGEEKQGSRTKTNSSKWSIIKDTMVKQNYGKRTL